MNAKPHPTEKFEFKSTLYDKLKPEERRKLNRAVVDRTQPTYRACYEHFHLADRDIGFYVFYRYARNLRRRAAVTDLAEATCPEGSDPVALNEAISRLLAYRLIEAADDETTDSRVLHRLTRAYHLSIRSQKTIHDNADRTVDKRCADREKDADALLKVAKAITKIRGEGIKQQITEYKLGRTIPQGESEDEPRGVVHDQPQAEAPNEPRRRSAAPQVRRPAEEAQASGSAPGDTNIDKNHKKAESPANAPPDRSNKHKPTKPPHHLDQIKSFWEAHTARAVERAEPGSIAEKIARIYQGGEALDEFL